MYYMLVNHTNEKDEIEYLIGWIMYTNKDMDYVPVLLSSMKWTRSGGPLLTLKYDSFINYRISCWQEQLGT